MTLVSNADAGIDNRLVWLSTADEGIDDTIVSHDCYLLLIEVLLTHWSCYLSPAFYLILMEVFMTH